MAEVDDLIIKIGADLSEMKKAFNDVEKRSQKATDKLNQEFKKTKKGADDAAKGIKNLAVRVAVMALAFKSAQKAVQSFAGAQGLVKMSKQLKISATEFAKLDNLAASLGGTTEDVSDTIKDLNERIKDAATNGGEYDEVLKSIGLSSTELARQTPTDQLDSFITALNNANDVGKQNFVVNTLAGDAGFRLAGAFSEIEGSVKDAANELAKIIDPISDIESAAVAKISKDFAVMDKQIERVAQKLTIGFAAALGVAVSSLGTLISDVNALVPSIEAFSKAGAFAFISLGILVDTTAAKLQFTKGLLLLITSAAVDLGIKAAKAFGGATEGAKSFSTSLKVDGIKAINASKVAAVQSLDALLNHAEKTKALHKEFMNEITLQTKIGNDEVVGGSKIAQTLLTNEQRVQIDKRRKLGKGSFTQQVNDAGNFFKSISVLMNSENRKQFEIGKAAAIGGAVVDTFKAATGAYAALAGIPFVGPALGAAAATAATLAGIANVNAIKAQSFGGSGAPSPAVPDVGGGGGDAAPAEAAPAQNITNANISLIGNSFSQDNVRDLINSLNEETDDNVILKVN